MARAFQALVPAFLVRPLLALAAIVALGLPPAHAAGRDDFEGGHPPLGAEIDLPDEAYVVVLDGDRAYVVRQVVYCGWGCIRTSKLSIHDLSTSGPHELLGSIHFLDDVRGLVVRNGFAYAASYYQFRVADVSDPTAVHEVGALVGWGIGPECVAVAGAHAYVGGDNGLHVVDVADPASPSIVASLALSGPAVSVALDGPFAYVGTRDGRVVVVDISNPVAPVEAAGIDLPGTPWDIELRGSHAYVSDGASGLQVLDISSPTHPRLVGRVDTPGTARRVALSGARAYVVDGGSEPPYGSGERFAGKLQVIDISHPTRPAIVNSIAGVDSIADVARWVHAEVRAVAADRGRVVVVGGLLRSWLEDCLGGPGACDYSSGYMTVTPRAAYEPPPPRSDPPGRAYTSSAPDAGASLTAVPATFALRGNTPNPFAVASSIRFEMPRASRVRIAIYDARGRLVKTLVDDALAPGVHETTWRGRTANGEGVPSGIYFVTMEAESFRQTRKIALVR